MISVTKRQVLVIRGFVAGVLVSTKQYSCSLVQWTIQITHTKLSISYSTILFKTIQKVCYFASIPFGLGGCFFLCFIISSKISLKQYVLVYWYKKLAFSVALIDHQNPPISLRYYTRTLKARLQDLTIVALIKSSYCVDAIWNCIFTVMKAH